jgi:flagellar export protein FliJ
MKPFSFSLDPVLHYRREIEGQKQRILAEALRRLQQAEDQVAALREEFKRCSSVLRRNYGPLPFRHLQTHYAHIEEVSRRISCCDCVIWACRIAVERARMEFIAASKERRIIETLKARRLAEHRAQEAATEQHDLDEANRVAYAAKRGCSVDGQIGQPTCFLFFAHGGG